MMYFNLILSLLAIFSLLLITELLWRRHTIHIETSRKIIHISTGLIVAFWPFYLDWTTIQLTTLLLLATIFISYRFNIFKSIHSIERLTIGEILYPLGIGLCALLQPAPWVFTIAILHLTLADGLAAIVGIKYGKRTSYTLISHGKSVVGSLTFFVTSFTILVTASFMVSENALPLMYIWFLWAALTLTLIENVSWYGLDDITVPLSVIVILTVLTT